MGVALRSSCFGPDASTASFETARRVAIEIAPPRGRIETIPVSAALDRVLAKPVIAPNSLPPFDQAAMDGYAVRLAGLADMPSILPVAGQTDAGDPPDVLSPATAHRIMTGAALPRGTDTVVMQEQAIRQGGFIQLEAEIARNTHIRRAGEDVGQGAVVLPQGRRIGWPEIALISALGIEHVSVAAPLRLAIVTTGSELRRGGEVLQPGQIYDANGPMLASLLRQADAEVALSTIADDARSIARTLEVCAATSDIVITTAGMAAGDKDHVHTAIGRVGGRLHVVGVAMKPGKPLALGRLGRACFVGLPGNPQAVAFGALAFVRPMVSALLGETPAARLTAMPVFPCLNESLRTELVPVRLGFEQGRLTAHRCGPGGSHRLMPMVAADAIAIVPPATTSADVRDGIEILPFDRQRGWR